MVLFFLAYVVYKMFSTEANPKKKVAIHHELMTERFIKEFLMERNGLIHTNLKNTDADVSVPAGEDSLSESLGLWMTYSIEKGDTALFAQSYQALESFFLTNDDVIAWKIEENGQQQVTTNALIDDLRIIGALLDASERWDASQYKQTALQIGEAVVKHNQYNGYLTDFYDGNTNQTSNSITLSYMDMDTIQKLYDYGVVPKHVFTQMSNLAEEIPDNQIFYPLSYRIVDQQFVYADEVHMIDQLYIAYHQAIQGHVSQPFLLFLKKEIEKGHIYGRYIRNTAEPAVSFESPALYGLAIMYCLEIGEKETAMKIYDRMQQFKIQDKTNHYVGGFVDMSTGDTHIFDNLFPLLAERMVLNEELLND
ncbi:glycosyl hydrolase family 8 [Peribacillus asahii]|uniref:glycosyl hydrolase family 8 n=1 Tax=Peribacillus asahii TaxID=228899 RepID=UPI00380DDC36